MIGLILVVIGIILALECWILGGSYRRTSIVLGIVSVPFLLCGIINIDWAGVGIWLDENTGTPRSTPTSINIQNPSDQHGHTGMESNEKVWVCRDRWFSLTNAKECRWE